MLFAEAEARRRAFDRIGLNVFGGNEVARHLYRSLGYAEKAMFMGKSL
jgi:ribosomal protein S18 acetylase RimI-like enzyme